MLGFYWVFQVLNAWTLLGVPSIKCNRQYVSGLSSLCNAVLKNGNRNTKSLAHTSLVRPTLEYGSSFWDSCRGRINALIRVQTKAAQCTNHKKDFHWEILAQHRKISCLFALFKAFSGEWVCKVLCNRLWRPYYLSRVDHVQKIRDRKQRTSIGEYSFINRSIKNQNKLPAEALGAFPCTPKIFRKR